MTFHQCYNEMTLNEMMLFEDLLYVLFMSIHVSSFRKVLSVESKLQDMIINDKIVKGYQKKNHAQNVEEN